MKTFSIILAASAMLMVATSAQAQMRVEGFKQVDPRLKQPRIETPSAQLPPRVASTAPLASAVQPSEPAITAPAAQAAAPVPVVRGSAGVGGPLQRPTYLEPDASQAPAGGPSSLDLMRQCFEGSISGAISNASCVGYMAGFIGAVRISAGISKDYPICLPEAGLSNEAIVSDVSAYLEENTAALQKSARSVVFLVLSKRYPCQGQ